MTMYIPPQPSAMDTMLAAMMDTASTQTMPFQVSHEGAVKEHIPDINTRRRIQNRNAQRNFRARQKKAKCLQQKQQEEQQPQHNLQQLPTPGLEMAAMSSYTQDTDWLSQLCSGTESPVSLPSTIQSYTCPSQELSAGQWDAPSKTSLSLSLQRQSPSSPSSSTSPSPHPHSGPRKQSSTRKGATTALHLAVECDHGNLVQILLAHEPQQYSVQDAQGRTALHIAAQKGSRDIIVKLLSMENESKTRDSEGDAGAGTGSDTRTLDLQDINGQTALLIATDRGHGAIVQELLRFGANPDIADCLGKRPLHVATLRGDRVLVQLLLEGQADTYLDLS